MEAIRVIFTGLALVGRPERRPPSNVNQLGRFSAGILPRVQVQIIDEDPYDENGEIPIFRGSRILVNPTFYEVFAEVVRVYTLAHPGVRGTCAYSSTYTAGDDMELEHDFALSKNSKVPYTDRYVFFVVPESELNVTDAMIF